LNYKGNKNSNGFLFSPNGSGTKVERTAGLILREGLPVAVRYFQLP